MLDINAEGEKSLSKLNCTVVYQYPETFVETPIISYYCLTECGGFYADNSECIQDGHLQIDVWSDLASECGELSILVNDVMEEDGWTREMSMDVPKKEDKIYHRTMRFQKYFTL
ncbi:MAG: hypothetical protein LIO53_02620 [Oscillospiraceae bacterium]|nr:hypothetical protein [Oscillospiraceae bacterium]